MELFREWDADGSGEIDKKEFRQAMKSLGFASMASRADIDAVFDEFDLSGDGAVDLNVDDRRIHQNHAPKLQLQMI